MGCPAKKVCKKAAGSALLQDETLVKKILTAVVAAVDIPVTLKMRTGWSKEKQNALAIGAIAENCGIAAVTLHGRTRKCKYNEAAEYETASQLKKILNIPLIVNGDIDSCEKARYVLNHTGADALMIGRAALGNPWIFREIDYYLNGSGNWPTPNMESVYDCVLAHVKALHRFYGADLGVRIARKHVVWYEERFPNFLSIKKVFNGIDHADEQIRLLEHSFEAVRRLAV
jgi:tRNA-dihydrouridine synthase B